MSFTSEEVEKAAPIPLVIAVIIAMPTLHTCNMQHKFTGKYHVSVTAIELNNKLI